MRLTIDFLLIAAFFLAYNFFGIFVATGTIMVGSIIQLLYTRWELKKWDVFSVRLAIIVCVLGAATLIFHNSIFIKWKPSILYWMLAIAFFSSHLFGKEPMLKKLLGEKIFLPEIVWLKLNLAWGIFFLVLGTANVYVLYKFTTTQWVYFKVIGCIGMSIVFMIAQTIYMSYYMLKKRGAAANDPIH